MPREPITRFLTEAECTRLINAAKHDFRQLVKAGLFTGARYTELTTLKAKDVNLDTGIRSAVVLTAVVTVLATAVAPAFAGEGHWSVGKGVQCKLIQGVVVCSKNRP